MVCVNFTPSFIHETGSIIVATNISGTTIIMCSHGTTKRLNWHIDSTSQHFGFNYLPKWAGHTISRNHQQIWCEKPSKNAVSIHFFLTLADVLFGWEIALAEANTLSIFLNQAMEAIHYLAITWAKCHHLMRTNQMTTWNHHKYAK